MRSGSHISIQRRPGLSVGVRISQSPVMSEISVISINDSDATIVDSDIESNILRTCELPVYDPEDSQLGGNEYSVMEIDSFVVDDANTPYQGTPSVCNISTQQALSGLDRLAAMPPPSSLAPPFRTPAPTRSTPRFCMVETPIGMRLQIQRNMREYGTSDAVAALRRERDDAIEALFAKYNSMIMEASLGKKAADAGPPAPCSPAKPTRPTAQPRKIPKTGKRAKTDENDPNAASQTPAGPFAPSQRYTSSRAFMTSPHQLTLTPFMRKALTPQRDDGGGGQAYVKTPRALDLNIMTLPQIKREMRRLGLRFSNREHALKKLSAHYDSTGTVPDVVVPVHLRMTPTTKRAYDTGLTAIIRASSFWTDILLFRPIKLDALHTYVNLSAKDRAESELSTNRSALPERLPSEARRLKRAVFSSAFLQQYLRDRGVSYQVQNEEKGWRKGR
ncbi:hypothetical protein J8273_6193 [Carpediemonas membranifera]|uniref:SAP domain-containing protein n=1 Tax=Carpediemonas membranifera TaxID=201153 RepID=A0A8J6DZZ7_9EUKA|nr:hypothetical protein J8273_6193 [Carpediemonas membranifera]|eukprot:KAG9391433.1 hypothetical protein J8273_6193 [Carpediemonas membranifera]